MILEQCIELAQTNLFQFWTIFAYLSVSTVYAPLLRIQTFFEPLNFEDPCTRFKDVFWILSNNYVGVFCESCQIFLEKASF